MKPNSNSLYASANVTESSFRYRTLDAWRGFACLLVVIYHSTMHVAKTAEYGDGWWSKLGYWLLTATTRFNVGVPIFFVISGYCIMATLDARRRKGDGVGVYLWRRFHRIYPPYWITLAISSMAIWLSERFIWPGLFTRSSFSMTDPTRLSLLEWLGNLTLTESWRYHLTGGNVRYLLGHAWTLCFEEQFYAVAGLILLLAPKRMFLAALVITVSIPLLGGWAHRNGMSLDGTILGGEWLLFAAGIAGYYRIHYAGRVGRLVIPAAFSVAVLLPALLFTDSDLRIPWIVAMSFAFLLAALHRHDAQLISLRLVAPFSFCGTICYSLYLIHPLVTTAIGHTFFRWGLRGNWETLLGTVPVSVTLSLAAGTSFFFLVERRFLNSSLRPAPATVDIKSLSIEQQLPSG